MIDLSKPLIAQTLINHGAEVNIKNDRGKTPLYNAVSKGHKDIVKLLIDRGAEISLQNKEIVQLLIDNGADTKYLNYETIKKLYKLSNEKYKDIDNFLKNNNF